MIFTDEIICNLQSFSASDLDVVNAARISFDSEHTQIRNGDEKLIDYLMRNRHGSPFEHGYFKFYVEAPLFVFREHHRHRSGHSYNEMSGRYTELQPKFYMPARARVQHGKAGAYTFEDGEDDLNTYLRAQLKHCFTTDWERYQALLYQGVAKEQARSVLPLAVYSKMIWSCNPRSLMHFISLRSDPTAQFEIQQVAKQAEAALQEAMPHTYEAFVINGRLAP